MNLDIEIKSNISDFNYDHCGNTAVAILIIDKTKIPLCSECVKELTESLEKFNNTIFCYKCEKFIMSENGWKYGGSCCREKEIKKKKLDILTMRIVCNRVNMQRRK